MPLDLDCTDPMYLLGRVVAALEGAHPDPRNRRAADSPKLDILLARPATGFPMLAKQFRDRIQVPSVQEIVALLPSGGLPKGPVSIEDQGPYWMGYYHQRGQEQRDMAMTARFTPEVMARIGETLFGGAEGWQAEMARSLRLSDRSRVAAWMTGNPSKRRRVPPGVCRDLLAMLRHRSAEAKALADEIDGADRA